MIGALVSSVDAGAIIIAPTRSDTTVAQLAARAKLARFPARSTPASWPTTTLAVAEVASRIRDLSNGSADVRWGQRLRGAETILRWLETFPGDNWQERWQASPIESSTGNGWIEGAIEWTRQQPGMRTKPVVVLSAGLLTLCALDVVRPDMTWLLRHRTRSFREIMAEVRDPEGFAALEKIAGPGPWQSDVGLEARGQIARLLAGKGGKARDITVGDCIEVRDIQAAFPHSCGSLFYIWLRKTNTFPPDSPVNLRQHTLRAGQISPAELVDRYQIRCTPIRNVIVDYLTERQPALDYTTLDDLSRKLASVFWATLEQLHPGIDSLSLTPQVAASWKEHIRVKRRREKQPDGSFIEVESPRVGYVSAITAVRAFYLDLAQWAVEDPARWGQWVAPCPIGSSEIAYKKLKGQMKARSDERTRARLPVLPVLIRTAEEARKATAARLTAMRSVPAGTTFTVAGETFTRAREVRTGTTGENESQYATDQHGTSRNLQWEEGRAFWGWAAVEFLRHTGVRIEEMLETTHHSLVQYKIPATGEVVPLLQIAPSKTDEERVLLVNPELADVLSAVVFRIRGATGTIPLVEIYDSGDKTWSPPMPALFQTTAGGHQKPISGAVIRKALDHLLSLTGLTDNNGRPLKYQPHDFRRIFVTDAIMSGLPPHIAQIICGHKSINTTMGYNTVYPAEAINAHRAFIARRRGMRPSEEYRTPTSEEWDAFLGHFEHRKLSIGTCGRAFGSSCIHEHACIRCSMLRPDQAQRPRMLEIRDNLTDRIAEAEREGWLGEIEGLRVSLAGAEDKLAQLDAQQARQTQAIHLGMPAFPDIAIRTTNAGLT